MTDELREKLFNALLGDCNVQDLAELVDITISEIAVIEPIIDAALDEAASVALARMLNKAGAQ